MSDKNENDVFHEALALRREIDPPRELWTGIEARIQVKKRRLVLARRSVTGASMLLAAAAIVLSIRSARQPHADDRARAAVVGESLHTLPTPSSPEPTATLEADEVVIPEEASYRDALSALAVTFAEEEKSLSPDDLARVGASLHAIDAAIVGTHAALAEHPEDGDLRAELDAEYEQKIDAMNDVLDWTTRS